MIRTVALGVVAAGAMLLGSVLTPLPASATPGMVSANGCHSHPRHCHSRGELRRNKRGRLYVPGAFSKGHRSHRRHGRRR